MTTLTKRLAEDLTAYFREAKIKVEYLHSDIDAIERVEILRNLRQGNFDVLIGINLLREGLDLPEVALVAVLDADKEGFLRSETSLIQTAGRAARHEMGRVIFYADKRTDSILRTLAVTAARREKQLAYNAEHGITPRSVKRAQQSSLQIYDGSGVREDEDAGVLAEGGAEDVAAVIAELEQDMAEASARRGFERAAVLRGALRAERDGDLRDAPEDGRLTRHAHQRLLVGIRTKVLDVEIVHRGGGHGVDGWGQRGGDDRRDDESRNAVRQRGDDEERQHLVVALQRARQRRPLVVGEQHDADHEKQRELQEDDEAAEHEARRRFFRRASREEALDEELVGAVRRQRQRDSAEQSGPEGVDRARVEREIEDAEVLGADARDFIPTAGDQAQQAEEDQQRAADVDEHLHDVGPDDGRRAAADGVDDHRDAEHEHRPGHRHLRDDRDHERRGEQANAVGERPRDEKDDRGDVLHRRAEPALQQLVGRVELAAEVRGNEEDAHQQPSGDVADGDLEKGHVSRVRAGGDADEAERAGLGRDDGEADRPPGHRPSRQEVVAGGFLEAREPGSEGDDREQVGGDDRIVEPVEDHAERAAAYRDPASDARRSNAARPTIGR